MPFSWAAASASSASPRSRHIEPSGSGPIPASRLWGQTSFSDSQANAGQFLVGPLGVGSPKAFVDRLPGRTFYVSDPLNPVFLWQWTHEHMGATYGRPALTQALVDLGSGPEERAVAILPGGMGTRGPGSCTLLPNFTTGLFWDATRAAYVAWRARALIHVSCAAREVLKACSGFS